MSEGMKAGTAVNVTCDDGSIWQTKTRSEPWQLGGGQWVVLLEGKAGGYSLDRVTARPVQQSRTCAETYLPLIAALLTVQSTHTTLTSGWCEDVCNAVKGLQQERDALEAKCLEEHVTIEQADAKVMKFEGEKGMWANERIDLLTQLENAESQLSQLQALVGKVFNAKTDDGYRNALIVLRGATLDAGKEGQGE